jgi:hypothetical protein
MDLREIGLEGVDWLRLDRDRDWWRAFVNTVMNLRDGIKDWEFLD